MDYVKFCGKMIINWIFLIGNLIELMVYLGFYKNDYLEKWVYGLLCEKGIEMFVDLLVDKLKIIVLDILNG